MNKLITYAYAILISACASSLMAVHLLFRLNYFENFVNFNLIPNLFEVIVSTIFLPALFFLTV